MSRRSFVILLVIFIYLTPGTSRSNQTYIGFGYGFGFLNTNKKIGKLGNSYYEYYRLSLLKENKIANSIYFCPEPFIAFVAQPHNGMSFGINGLLKYYMGHLFINGGLGISYNTIKYHKQACKVLTMPQAGIGILLGSGKISVESRFIHMSNGGTDHPNGAVNSIVMLVGFAF